MGEYEMKKQKKWKQWGRAAMFLSATLWAGVTGAMEIGIEDTPASLWETTVSSMPQSAGPVMTAPHTPAFEDKHIEINLASRLLTLYQGDVRIRLYPIAPGKPDSPTPQGRRTVVSLDKNPTWIDPDNPDVVVPSGPDNPLGYRWIGLGGAYGIHGTNSPWSIGNYASHGCVRMYEKDVEDLFDHIVKGIPVDIIYERVIVEKTPDCNVVYYIYPDGYGIQYLTAAKVRSKMEPFAVDAFAEDAEIVKAIRASDGKPNLIAKVYPVYLGGMEMNFSAYEKDGDVYLPAMPLAKALGIRAEWSPTMKQIRTPYGRSSGIEKGKSLYIRAIDLPFLFGLAGYADGKGNFILR